jgi:hypothetical protein
VEGRINPDIISGRRKEIRGHHFPQSNTITFLNCSAERSEEWFPRARSITVIVRGECARGNKENYND